MGDQAQSGPLWLVGDVGATHLRFGLARPTASGFRVEAMRQMRGDDVDGLEGALSIYLDDMLPARPVAAALAIAGPISGGDAVALTNRDWRWSNAALAERFGFRRLLCLNDAEAQALALAWLDPGDLRPLGGGSAVPDAPRLLIAPGSGLGVAALVRADGRYMALAGEGGHATFAPESDLERALADALRAEHGAHVSWERVLSGPGIAAIYDVVRAARQRGPSDADAAEIVRRAAADDPSAQTALATFGGLLGAYAGDLALILGARGGVYIGGGIAPAIADALAVGPLRERFEAKGRFTDYLRAVPTAIVMRPHPGLIGAAAFLAAQPGEQGQA
ncbi:MAG: glucokinase [Dongiaceae bacterium]